MASPAADENLLVRSIAPAIETHEVRPEAVKIAPRRSESILSGAPSFQ